MEYTFVYLCAIKCDKEIQMIINTNKNNVFCLNSGSPTSARAGLSRLRHPLHAFLPPPCLEDTIDFQHHLQG